MQCGMQI